jgi:hypothetical protein
MVWGSRIPGFKGNLGGSSLTERFGQAMSIIIADVDLPLKP